MRTPPLIRTLWAGPRVSVIEGFHCSLHSPLISAGYSKLCHIHKKCRNFKVTQVGNARTVRSVLLPVAIVIKKLSFLCLTVTHSFIYPSCPSALVPIVLDLQPGAAGFQLSNPPVLQCMLLKASVNVFSHLLIHGWTNCQVKDSHCMATSSCWLTLSWERNHELQNLVGMPVHMFQ
jgi:hypothetical protein